jgi:carbon monoxide dehydrogenase subunit G
MKIAGQTTLAATAESLWPLIFDPRTLMQLLPGCEQIEQVAPDEYRGRLTLRIPAVAGSYETWVKVLQAEAPSFCRIEGEASGPGGRVRGQASFSLQPEAEQTRIVYQGDALIGGPLAGMNPRFAEGVAQTLIRQGLARLPELAREREAALQATSVVPAAPSGVRRWSAWWAGVRRWLTRIAGRFSRRGKD